MDSCTLRSGRWYSFLREGSYFEDCLQNRLVPRWADCVWSVFLSVVAVVGLPFASWRLGFCTDTSRCPSCPHYYSSFFSDSKSIYYLAFKWQTVKAAQMEASVLFCDVLLIKIIRLPAEPNRSASPLYLGTSFSRGKERPNEDQVKQGFWRNRVVKYF